MGETDKRVGVKPRSVTVRPTGVYKPLPKIKLNCKKCK